MTAIWIGRAAAALLIASALAAAGCAALPDSRGGDEAAVRQRAQQRWDALVAGDADKAYEFWSTGSKAFMSLQHYRRSIPLGFWTAARVESVACTGERCEAKVAIEYKLAPKNREIQGHQMVTDTWLKESGDWFFVFKP